jgi:hypothetical protein
VKVDKKGKKYRIYSVGKRGSEEDTRSESHSTERQEIGEMSREVMRSSCDVRKV